MMYRIDPAIPLAAQLHRHDLYLHQNFRDGGVLLYRFWGANEALLYIGVTVNPGIRWQAHKNRAAWWPSVVGVTVERHSHEGLALDAEVAAIRSERPAFNVRSAIFTEQGTEQRTEHAPQNVCATHWGKGREGIGREEEGSSLLTFANADTRERAVNGPHASDSLPPNAPRRDAGKAKALTRWAG